MTRPPTPLLDAADSPDHLVTAAKSYFVRVAGGGGLGAGSTSDVITGWSVTTRKDAP